MLVLIAPFVAAMVNLALGVLVFRRSRRDPVHRSFALMLAGTAVWALATFFMRGSQDPAAAGVWAKLVLMAFPFTALFFLFFSAAVTGFNAGKWPIAAVTVSAAGLTALAGLTGLVSSGAEAGDFGYRPAAGPLSRLYFYYVYVLVGLGVAVLFRSWRTTPYPHLKNRVAYILIASGVILLSGPLPYLPVLGIPNYPRSAAAMTLFTILATWVILQPRLPDIGSLLRKGLVFLVLAIAGSLIFIPARLALPLLDIPNPELLRDILFFWAILATLLFLPLRGRVQGAVEKALFRERYLQLQHLARLIRETGDLEKMETLPPALVSLIARTMKASAARLFIFSPAEENFSCLAADPGGTDAGRFRIAHDSPLAGFLRRQQRAFAVSEATPQTAAALASLEDGETSLVLPLQFEGRLIGFLTLGGRLSGRAYSQGDLHLLDGIAPQLALGLRNLQLHRTESGRISDLAALRESISVIGSSLEKKSLLHRAVEEGAALLGAPAVAFWELQEEKDEMHFVIRSASGLSAGYIESQKLPLRQVLPGGIENINSMPLFLKFSIHEAPVGDHQLNIREGLIMAMGVPVISRGRFIGALSFFHKTPGRLFTQRDVEMARNFASHLGIALENARLYEMERAERRELEEMEGQRQLFLAAISHELRTPVTSMKLVTDLLVEEMDDSEIPSHKKMVGNLKRSLDNLHRRVEDLVAFARLQNPVVRIELDPVPLPEAIRSAAELCQPFFAAKKQALKISVPESLPLVRGDAFRLEQIIANLLWNASKFTPDGSETIVRAKIVDGRPGGGVAAGLQPAGESAGGVVAGLQPAGAAGGQAVKQRGGELNNSVTQRTHFVLVEIEDHGGPGISPEEQQAIFRPFYTAAPGRGLGLGLAIVKRLVELHGGKIWVTSQPGATTFSFTIPIAD